MTWLESEKQLKMREDKWKKEDEARIQLMRDVYHNRARHIEMKKMNKEEEKWLLNHDKKQIETELQRQNREYEEKKARDALIKKEHQGDILRQIGERDRNTRRDLQEKMYEERAAKLAEIQYVKKIETQKQENASTLK